MQASPSACVTLSKNVRCQKVEIALNSTTNSVATKRKLYAGTFVIATTLFQQHPPITTGLDSVATKHELCANAWHFLPVVVATTNDFIEDTHLDVDESEEGESVWGFKFYSNSNWANLYEIRITNCFINQSWVNSGHVNNF